MQMILASTNRGKYREMKAQLEPLGIELLFGGDFEKPLEVDETGEGYAENALLKARAWAEATGLPALADDSGLEAEALGGIPGIHSARIIAGSDRDRMYSVSCIQLSFFSMGGGFFYQDVGFRIEYAVNGLNFGIMYKF